MPQAVLLSEDGGHRWDLNAAALALASRSALLDWFCFLFFFLSFTATQV